MESVTTEKVLEIISEMIEASTLVSFMRVFNEEGLTYDIYYEEPAEETTDGIPRTKVTNKQFLIITQASLK